MMEYEFQAEIVQAFADIYPHLYGKLWMIKNDPRGRKQVMFYRAMGLVSGVSDLQLFSNGIFSGIELKTQGSKHSKEHLECQLLWGKSIVEEGGNYIMSDNYDNLMIFFDTVIVKKQTGLFIIDFPLAKKIKLDN